MTKEERIRGAALDACPQCGAEYAWFAQHWARSADCGHPVLDDHQHDMVQGLLLGDGSVEGNPEGNAKIRFATATRRFAEWAYDHLGWIASSLDRHSRSDGEDQFRVVTLAHPELNHYRDWYGDDGKRLPCGYRFTPTAARAFHACDGTLSFGYRGRPHIEYRAATEQYRDRLLAALSRAGFSATESEKRVRILADGVDAWLEWIGDPAPGVSHKWETNRVRYRALQATDDDGVALAVEMSRAALELVAKQTSRPPTPEDVEEHADALGADRIADILGGGSWDDALSVADVQGPVEQRKPYGPGGSLDLDIDEAADVISTAADDVGEPLTIEDYQQWRADKGDSVVSGNSITQKFGWKTACDAAGVEHGVPWKNLSPDDPTYPGYSTAELEASIDAAAIDIGEPIRRKEYDIWARDRDRPAPNTITNRFGGWEAACNAADVEPNISNEGRDLEWTDDDCYRALQRAAEEMDGSLSVATYERWRSEIRERVPSRGTIADRLGWSDAKKAAGVE